MIFFSSGWEALLSCDKLNNIRCKSYNDYAYDDDDVDDVDDDDDDDDDDYNDNSINIHLPNDNDEKTLRTECLLRNIRHPTLH